MDVRRLKEDVQSGKISVDRLIELMVTMQRELQAAKRELDVARRQIEDLKQQQGGPPSSKVSEPFSVEAEERRQEREERNGGSGSGGFGVGE